MSAEVAQGSGEPSAPGTYIWVGKHRLHLHCKGSGSPTVVFDAGLGGSSLDWTLVHPEVAGFTRACAYDRAGYAWSDPGPLPRDSRNIVKDLEQLLGNGSVAAPYVLVGHSLGGLIVQRFARQHPHRIAGLVLVDATHEDQFRRLQEAMISDADARRWTLTTMYSSYRVPEGLPDEVRQLATAFESRVQSIIVARSELTFLHGMARAVPTGPATASAMGNIPDVPLVVISHRVIPPATATRKSRLAETWMALQLELVSLSRQSRHVIAGTDDHYVHVREPELVIDAVRSIVEQHRLEKNLQEKNLTEQQRGTDAGAPAPG
jgi:pimeloyl-ACP methyl ester carboxylesterase